MLPRPPPPPPQALCRTAIFTPPVLSGGTRSHEWQAHACRPVACPGNGMVRTGRHPPRIVLPIKRLHLATARSRTGKPGPGAKPAYLCKCKLPAEAFPSNSVEW
ncbi:hypothetical protein S7711_10459 [Stachybotrys chartarum IBT 7711]|uniref:Uncharacterized protein n=1 Tax=Stachybotrys chartarum (strain CBS 109288 / IBT 7711) TaxID=1280523 RepID=A0A084B6T8_STACB|nr:hypothetical protein S7711_10459 [Stachybotrys chartarum IBT 7711]KFA46520.1 hypothetical protein S40293_10797 [Stachybotrys chartarum IBT 40293]